MINDAIAQYLAHAAHAAHAQAPHDPVAFLMRPALHAALHAALHRASIPIPLPVWHSLAVGERIDADGNRQSAIAIYRVADLEAMRAA